MRPLLTNYEELSNQSKPLPSNICDMVILTATPIKIDDTRLAPDANGTYKTQGNEVLWGIAGSEASHTLYVGETSQPIPVQNLDQIIVRCPNPAVGQVVIYSIFIEQKEQLI